jgi:magnesium-transporting ATPase (P-type)
MHACETMGGANYICTDKTGTLTKNEMNIYRILTIEKEITLSETLDSDENKFNIKNNKHIIDYKIRESHQQYFPNENYWDQLKLSIALNVSGQIREYEGKDINGDMEYCETKNKTDKAFIDFLYRFRVSISSERDKYMSDNKYYKQIPFDSKLKRMTSFVCNEIFPTGYRLFSKGAAEQAKTVCRNYLDPKTGEIKPIGDQERKFISEKIIKFNKQMLRSLYVCYKDITQEEYENCEVYRNSEGLSIDQYGCVFIACVGLRDSLRNGVKESVIKCHSAGVNVIMVTGDNIITATAIAKDCNILGDDINLENLNPGDVEEEPELTDSPIRGEEHIREILLNKPQAITGNTFYVAIGGLICSSCNLETNMCKCPKTQAEAEKIEKTKKNKRYKN